MPKRYFENTLSDDYENVVNTPLDHWNDKIHDLVECVSQNARSSPKNTLYTGTTGIAYMFYRLAVSDKFKYDSTTFLNKAVEILKLRENRFDCKKLGQFISGDAGVNAVSAAIYHQLGDVKMASMYLEQFERGLTNCKPMGRLRPGDDELFVGRSGYLYGVLWLEKVFGRKILQDQDVIEICSVIVESGRNYSKKTKSKFPLMFLFHNKEYLGKCLFNLCINNQ